VHKAILRKRREREFRKETTKEQAKLWEKSIDRSPKRGGVKVDQQVKENGKGIIKRGNFEG